VKGEVEWQKTFGGEGSDAARSIQQTTDGGYIIAGWTYSSDSGGTDVYILKLNSKEKLNGKKRLVERIMMKPIQFNRRQMEDIYSLDGLTLLTLEKMFTS